MTTKTKLKPRWDRIFILLVAIALILGVTVKAMASEKSREYIEIEVNSGDTLWSLIHEYNPDYHDDMSKACYIVKNLNGMQQAMIYSGQTLLMPTDL